MTIEGVCIRSQDFEIIVNGNLYIFWPQNGSKYEIELNPYVVSLFEAIHKVDTTLQSRNIQVKFEVEGEYVAMYVDDVYNKKPIAQEYFSQQQIARLQYAVAGR